MILLNYMKNFKGFIASCGIYLNGKNDAKFVEDVLGITPSNRWGTSKKIGLQKRKFLVCLGESWKYIALSKDYISNNLDIEDFKRMLRDVVSRDVKEDPNDNTR